MSKWLHEFVINKQETSTESHSETNDKGEKITTEKDVVKEIPTYFAIRKPTRKLYDEADLYYSVKLAEGIKAGLLTRSLLEKRFENDGGVFSEGDKDRYFELYKLIFQKETDLQECALNLKNAPEEEKNKKLAELYTELTLLKRDLQQYETLYSSLFEQTAENRAKNSTVMWWVLFLGYYKNEEDEEYKPIFDGEGYDTKIESYDTYEESEDTFWLEAIKKTIYFVSFWYSGNGKTEEDFKEAESFYTTPTEKKEEESEENTEETEEPTEEPAEETVEEKPKRRGRKKKTQPKEESAENDS